jgi:hypothetical protein
MHTRLDSADNALEPAVNAEGETLSGGVDRVEQRIKAVAIVLEDV